jgi:hypothetical protein
VSRNIPKGYWRWNRAQCQVFKYIWLEPLSLPKLPKLRPHQKNVEGRNSWRAEQLRDCYDDVLPREGRSLRPRCELANRLAEGSKGRRLLYWPRRSFERINSGTHHHRKSQTDQCRSDSIMEMLAMTLQSATTELTLLLLLLLFMYRVLSKTFGMFYWNDSTGSPMGLHRHIRGVLSSSISTRLSSGRKETYNGVTKGTKLHAKRTKGKGKGHPITGHDGPRWGVEV